MTTRSPSSSAPWQRPTFRSPKTKRAARSSSRRRTPVSRLGLPRMSATPLTVVRRSRLSCPSDSDLQAELYAPSRAAGFLGVGQEVLLRYEAYPYQKFGHYRGRVSAVSQTALAPTAFRYVNGGPDGGGEPMFRGDRRARESDRDRLWRASRAETGNDGRGRRAARVEATLRMGVRAALFAERRAPLSLHCAEWETDPLPLRWIARYVARD